MVEQLLKCFRASGEGEAIDKQIFLNETNTISGYLGASLFVGNVDLTVAETECSRRNLPLRCLSRRLLLDAGLRRSPVQPSGLTRLLASSLRNEKDD